MAYDKDCFWIYPREVSSDPWDDFTQGWRWSNFWRPQAAFGLSEHKTFLPSFALGSLLRTAISDFGQSRSTSSNKPIYISTPGRLSAKPISRGRRDENIACYSVAYDSDRTAESEFTYHDIRYYIEDLEVLPYHRWFSSACWHKSTSSIVMLQSFRR